MRLHDLLNQPNHSELSKLVVLDIQKAVQLIFGLKAEITPEDLSEVPANLPADFAFPCFSLAKQLKMPPLEVAHKLQDGFLKSQLIETAVAAGPYCNLTLAQASAAAKVIREIQSRGKNYGTTKKSVGANVMMEYSSPNTNKPQHLGHIRNNLLGYTVSQLLQANGVRVITSSIVNDRGIHICKSMLAYQKWGGGATPDTTQVKPDHFVGSWYVKFEQELQREREVFLAQRGIEVRQLSDLDKRTVETEFLNQSRLMIEARTMLQRWEDGDESVKSLWKQMNGWVYAGFAETYRRLGVTFDVTFYESEIYTHGREIVQQALANAIFVKGNTGQVIAPLSRISPLPDKVVQRSDGTSVYITQDMYLAKLKFDTYKLDYSIYCVGAEQELYLKQLFTTLQLIDQKYGGRLSHLSYGMVFLPEGKMKSREGKVVDADDLMAGMVDLAIEEIGQRFPELSAEDKAARAEVIGLAALKYYILSFAKDTAIHFDPKKSISFEGNTGPYLLYVYARISSILENVQVKANASPAKGSDLSPEWPLIRKLSAYPTVVALAAQDMDPSRLTTYLFELAQDFNTYYHQHSVLRANDELKPFKIAVIEAVQITIKNGLTLLGIETLEKM